MNIREMLVDVERIFEATNSTVEAMNDGDRVQLQQLTQTVSLMVAMDPKNVLNFVSHFVHNSDVVYVSRGKNGGVIKGTKPTKMVTPKPNDDLNDM